MRILFFSDHFLPEPSAPAAHVYERAKLWVEWGHEVTVVTSAPNFPEGRVYPGYRNAWRQVEVMEGVRVVRVKTFIARNEGTFRRTLDYLSYAVSAWAMAQFEGDPDVVISTSPHLFCPLAGILYARPRGIPHVFEIRDLWPASIREVAGLKPGIGYRLLEQLELWMYRSSRRIISFTRSYVPELTNRGVPADKIDVVINAANLDLFSPQPPDAALRRRLGLEGRFVVGYLGTVGLAHDLGNMVAAAQAVVDIPVTFMVVGVGAERESLEARVREKGLTNILFVGRQLRQAMPSFWSICDIALVHLKASPLFAKVIPSKMFEAMAMGIPLVFAGPDGEGASIVRETGAGVVVKAADPAALAAAVRELFVDQTGRQDLARASAAAATKFSRVRQARDTILSLEEASRGGRMGGSQFPPNITS